MWQREERVPVWSATCADDGDGAPLALGMVLSSIMHHDGGRLLERFELAPITMDAESTLDQVESAGRPGVLLTSNYLWTIAGNLDLARRVKAVSPAIVTVFGGPSAPKYEGDAAAFLERHPEVDILVRGEGEGTAPVLLDALAAANGSVDAMAPVEGTTVRTSHGVLRAPERPRLSDLNEVPSPYLLGLFDHLANRAGVWAVETNRGCPYGCTFCDWGSATLSRVRHYDIQRVLDEIAWFAQHDVPQLFIADANFGMFAKDVDIATHATSLFVEHGAPSVIYATYAKNTTKHIVPIVEMFVKNGMMGEATISFQTVDETVLTTIQRRNIKLTAYHELAEELHRRDLPVLADIMLGLPGGTLETLKTDLQVCIDADVTARVFGTFVLPNSPMNEPGYRSEHGIEVDDADQLIASTSFTAEERAEMIRFRDIFRLADHFGVLRHVLRYVALVTGRREVDVLWTIHLTAQADPDSYPLASYFLLAARRYLNVPLSWSLFYDEIRRIADAHLDMADDAGFPTVLRVQQTLMPEPGRAFPSTVALDHDYVSFYRDAIEGRVQTAASARPLAAYGPGELTVDDPRALSEHSARPLSPITYTAQGTQHLFSEGIFSWDADWELESPLLRPLRAFELSAAHA